MQQSKHKTLLGVLFIVNVQYIGSCGGDRADGDDNLSHGC